MVLVVEARHGVIRLRREVGFRDASARQRFEDRKSSAAHQTMDERGNENGLARTRHAGHAEADGGIDQITAKFEEGPGTDPELLDHL